MKKMLSIIAIGTLALVACGGQEQPKTEASVPSGYKVVSKTSVNYDDDSFDVKIIDLVNKETGCKFVMTVHKEGTSIEQVHRVSVQGTSPDCEAK